MQIPSKRKQKVQKIINGTILPFTDNKIELTEYCITL